MLDATADTWDDLIAQPRPLLVQFWAEWCSPCRSLRPVLEAVEGHFGDRLRFARVNVDAEQDLCERYQVQAVPTLLLVCGGTVQFQRVGVMTQSALALMLYRAVE